MLKFIKNKKGFTLIELIVVLAVLAIIMAIAVPRFLGIQESARENADHQTVQLIAKAAELYFVQRDDPDEDEVTVAELTSGSYLDAVMFQSKLYTGSPNSIDDDGSSLVIEFDYDTGSITIDSKETDGKELYPDNELD